MIELFIFVEGFTEEEFIKNVIHPHLWAAGVVVIPLIVETSRSDAGVKHKGGGHWRTWKPDIQRLLQEHRARRNVHVSTLFDLYGLPHDFPGLNEHRGVADTARRAGLLEAAMEAEFSNYRFIPYIQRHEFEALVLASLDFLIEDPLLVEQDQRAGVEKLALDIAGIKPEDVNDGGTTAPSKRLSRFVPGYEKSLHGPLAVQAMVEANGLEEICAKCPRFSDWLERLRRLGDTDLEAPQDTVSE